MRHLRRRHLDYIVNNFRFADLVLGLEVCFTIVRDLILIFLLVDENMLHFFIVVTR